MKKEEAERLWREYLSSLGSFVSDDLAAKLQRCADEHGLDFEELYKWADLAIIANAMLENVESGTLDVVSMENGEPAFQATKTGMARTEALLNETPEGATLLRLAKAERKRTDKILSARLISDS